MNDEENMVGSVGSVVRFGRDCGLIQKRRWGEVRRVRSGRKDWGW